MLQKSSVDGDDTDNICQEAFSLLVKISNDFKKTNDTRVQVYENTSATCCLQDLQARGCAGASSIWGPNHATVVLAAFSYFAVVFNENISSQMFSPDMKACVHYNIHASKAAEDPRLQHISQLSGMTQQMDIQNQRVTLVYVTGGRIIECIVQLRCLGDLRRCMPSFLCKFFYGLLLSLQVQGITFCVPNYGKLQDLYEINKEFYQNACTGKAVIPNDILENIAKEIADLEKNPSDELASKRLEDNVQYVRKRLRLESGQGSGEDTTTTSVGGRANFLGNHGVPGGVGADSSIGHQSRSPPSSPLPLHDDYLSRHGTDESWGQFRPDNLTGSSMMDQATPSLDFRQPTPASQSYEGGIWN